MGGRHARALRALAAALAPLLEPDATAIEHLAEVNKTAGHLSDGTASLKELARSALDKQLGSDRLLPLRRSVGGALHAL